MASSGRYTNLSIYITGEPFCITCYGLVLDSFEMVLGVQWLEALGPVLWDFHRRVLAVVRDVHHIIWVVTPSASKLATLFTVTIDMMVELLQQYNDLFTSPTCLSPKR
jgi:hypothetical protein